MSVPPAQHAPDGSRHAVTDSPWFWGCVFSGMALAALVVAERKFGPRQATIERQFQGRQWAQLKAQSEQNYRDGIRFSTDEETVITLGPLRWLVTLVFIVSTTCLVRERRRILKAKTLHPPPS